MYVTAGCARLRRELQRPGRTGDGIRLRMHNEYNVCRCPPSAAVSFMSP
jgi:hypothetical protein